MDFRVRVKWKNKTANKASNFESLILKSVTQCIEMSTSEFRSISKDEQQCGEN